MCLSGRRPALDPTLTMPPTGVRIPPSTAAGCSAVAPLVTTRSWLAPASAATSIPMPAMIGLASEYAQLIAQMRVKIIAQPVAQQVEGQGRDQDGQARVDGQPPVSGQDLIAAVGQHRAPGWNAAR